MRYTFGVTGAVSAVILLLALSILLPSSNLKFFEYEFGKNGTYASINMEKPELLRVSRHMIDYLFGKQSELNLEATVNGEQRLFFDETDITHMKDVKDLFKLCRFSLYISAIVLILSAIFLRKNLVFLLKCVKNATIAALCVLGMITGSALINFEAAFVIFHKIFFRNDLWILDIDKSLLINILPERFFIDIAIAIGALFALLCVIVIIISLFTRARATAQEV